MYRVKLEMGLKSADFLLFAVNECISNYQKQLQSETITDDEISDIRNDLIVYESLKAHIEEEIEKAQSPN